MEDAPVSDADQSCSRGTDEQRHGADRCGIGEPPDEHELSSCGVGPTGRHDHHAAGRMGHVLQRNGGLTRRPCLHQRRQLALRPLPRGAAELGVRPDDRPIHRPGKHGARALVSDGDDTRRWPRDDLLGAVRIRHDEYGGGDLHGRVGMEPGVSVRLDPSPVPTNAPLARWSRLRLWPRAGHDDLQSDHEGLVPGGHDQLQRHAHVWLVGAPAPDACGRIQTACDDLRRR